MVETTLSSTWKWMIVKMTKSGSHFFSALTETVKKRLLCSRLEMHLSSDAFERRQLINLDVILRQMTMAGWLCLSFAWSQLSDRYISRTPGHKVLLLFDDFSGHGFPDRFPKLLFPCILSAGKYNFAVSTVGHWNNLQFVEEISHDALQSYFNQ